MPSSYTKPNGTYKGKQRFICDPSKFIFNIDTFWFTIDALNYNDVLEDYLLDQLQSGRDKLDDGIQEHTLLLHPDYDNPIAFAFKGARYPYSYTLRSNDMAFTFMKRRIEVDGKAPTYPIKVEINQYILWEKGIHRAYKEALYLLSDFGFELGHAKPSRIDPCVHTDQWQFNLNDLSDFSYPKNVKNDNKPDFQRLDPSTGDFETVYFGDRSRLQLRIYNKGKEIIDNNKFFFYDYYEKYGLRPNMTWNIEFQIMRNFLKDFINPYTGEHGYFDDVDTLLYEDGLSVLWSYLTKDRFGFGLQESELSSNPFWRHIQQGDAEKFKNIDVHIFRSSIINDEKMREVAQIRGRLMKLIVNEQTEYGEEVLQGISSFLTLLEKYEEDKGKDFTYDLNIRKLKYQDQKINGLLSKKQKKWIELNQISASVDGEKTKKRH